MKGLPFASIACCLTVVTALSFAGPGEGERRDSARAIAPGSKVVLGRGCAKKTEQITAPGFGTRYQEPPTIGSAVMVRNFALGRKRLRVAVENAARSAENGFGQARWSCDRRRAPLKFISASRGLPGNAARTVRVRCPSGHVAFAGFGASPASDALGEGARVVELRLANARTVSVRVENPSATPGKATARAGCTGKGKVPVEAVRTKELPAGGVDSTFAKCGGKGRKVLFGGFSLDQEGGGHSVVSLIRRPVAKTWLVGVSTGGGPGGTYTARAYCG